MSEVAFAFVDIETTGLNPADDVVLEIGIVLTDKNLETIAEKNWVFHYPIKSRIIHNSDVILMHNKSGLWEECNAAPWGSGGTDSDEEITAWLTEYAVPGEIEMAGSTINFDRGFLDEWLPSTLNWFHYRNVDVSSFKVTFQKFGIPDNPAPGKKLHRAIPDCYDTISDYRYYLTYLGIFDVG